MRCAGARAAALLLTLVLGTAGCELVSSLTPFGIGTQDYGAGEQNVNGNWEGSTASGGTVTFQVGNSEVIELLLYHQTSAPGCGSVPFDATAATTSIVDGSFTLEMALEPQGRFVATGNFTSATTCSGNYIFEAMQAGSCPTTGSGTFIANKVF